MDGSPGWQVMGHQSPGTAASQDVEDGIDDFASRVFDIDCLFRYRRDQGLQDFPLRIGQIRGIRFPVFHLFFSILVLFTYSSPFLYRLHDPKLTLSKNGTCPFPGMLAQAFLTPFFVRGGIGLKLSKAEVSEAGWWSL